MTILRRVLAVSFFVALLVAGWTFERGNTAAVSIHYLFGTTEAVPVWVVVAGAFGGGLVLAGVYLGVALLRDRVEIGRLRRVVRNLENELKDFRNKPLQDALESDDLVGLEAGDDTVVQPAGRRR